MVFKWPSSLGLAPHLGSTQAPIAVVIEQVALVVPRAIVCTLDTGSLSQPVEHIYLILCHTGPPSTARYDLSTSLLVFSEVVVPLLHKAMGKSQMSQGPWSLQSAMSEGSPVEGPLLLWGGQVTAWAVWAAFPFSPRPFTSFPSPF